MSTDQLNMDALKQVLDLGGVDLLNRLIEMFHQTILDRLSDAEEAIKENRLDDLHRELHSIRSSAGNLGADKLSAACLESETAIKEGRELNWLENLRIIQGLHATAHQNLVDFASEQQG